MYYLGTDCTIIAHSLPVGQALQAAELLAAEGISCEGIYINIHCTCAQIY